MKSVDLSLGRNHGTVHRAVVAALRGLAGEEDSKVAGRVRQRVRQLHVGDPVLKDDEVMIFIDVFLNDP